MARETLTAAREEFKRKCIPADAGPEQRIESERAFMAGAVVMYALMMAATRHEDDDVGAAEMEALHHELIAYERELDAAARAEARPRRRRES